MRLVDFMPKHAPDRTPRMGLLGDAAVLEIGGRAAGTLLAWLERGMPDRDGIEQHAAQLRALGHGGADELIAAVYSLDAVEILAPIRRPPALRDFYAFEQHVKAGSAIRGRDVPRQWYDIPVFYFSHTGSIVGPEETVSAPTGSQALDFELEVACVIGKSGRDIAAEDAEQYIAGYTIFNDWSARDLQRQEVSVGLGPAKAKDFASALGPWLVTPDELADRHAGRPGVYNLEMIARVNGIERSRGNWRDIHFSFGQMIARASASVTLQPGDVIGSGTVGTGCLLELTQGNGPWLQPGDVVELEIERLGVLRNTVAG